MRKHVGVGVLFAVVVAMGCASTKAKRPMPEAPGFNLNNKLTFATLTYSQDGDQVPRPAVQLDFQLYAATQLDVMGPWDQPREVAACLRAISGPRLQALAGVIRSGSRAPDGGSPDSILDGWSFAVWQGLAESPLPAACDTILSTDSDDRLQLAWTLGHLAQRVDELARNAWLLSDSQADVAKVFAAAEQALVRHAALIANTPDVASPAHNNLPVLALSGGAANGAFSAGLLYELLSAREEALVALHATPSSPMAKASRFKSITGTSVGALLAELVDFSMLDEAAFDSTQRAWLNECNTRPSAPQPSFEPFTPSSPTACEGSFAGWPEAALPQVEVPTRPVMNCALRKLAHYFTDADERELICVEPGSVGRVIGLGGRPRTNFMRFDPMEKSAVTPLLDTFAKEMTENEVTRVLSAVDTQQNVLLGLDERACATGPDAAAQRLCRSSAVMASLVLPLFARPVSRVSSGFDPRGECGIWFDGGLRSELSTLRALTLSRANVVIDANNTLASDGSTPPADTCADGTRCEHDRLRVLGFSNGRSAALPHNKPNGIQDVLFDGLDQFLDQQGPAELALAQALAMQREAEFVALSRAGTLPGFARAPSTTHRQLSPASIESRVQVLHVPSEVPPWVVFGAGYSFDPWVMRGLFIWGRKTMRESLKSDLVRRLGWPRAMQDAMAAVIVEREKDVRFADWLNAYRSQRLCDEFFRWRTTEGRTRLRSEAMPVCAEPDAPDAPPYFLCRDGLDVGNGSTR